MDLNVSEEQKKDYRIARVYGSLSSNCGIGN